MGVSKNQGPKYDPQNSKGGIFLRNNSGLYCKAFASARACKAASASFLRASMLGRPGRTEPGDSKSFPVPGRPAAHNLVLLCLHDELLLGIVACQLGLLGFLGRVF